MLYVKFNKYLYIAKDQNQTIVSLANFLLWRIASQIENSISWLLFLFSCSNVRVLFLMSVNQIATPLALNEIFNTENHHKHAHIYTYTFR